MVKARDTKRIINQIRKEIMRNIYIVYNVCGAYKYVQSVYSSKAKALRNIEEIRLELEEPYANLNEFHIGGVRWTDDNSVINSAYVEKQQLR